LLCSEEAGVNDKAAELEQAAVRLLATREHSRAELRRKLMARGGEASAVEGVLDALAERRLQSDARYAEQYVAQRAARGYGPARIRAELRERGIDDAVIADWLDERDPVWKERVAEVARKRFGAACPADFGDRARRARFLEYRGFGAKLIRRVLFAGGDDE
jgi:regulatory protein